MEHEQPGLWLTTLYVWTVEDPRKERAALLNTWEFVQIDRTDCQVKGAYVASEVRKDKYNEDFTVPVVRIESRCYGKPDGLYPDLICETIEVDPSDYEDGEPTSYEKPVCYVSVYAVTRHYGGPEEGGWWYNWTAHELSIPLIRPGNAEEIEKVKAFLREHFVDDGNIYSVNGGVEYHFQAECVPGSSATKKRPHYE